MSTVQISERKDVRYAKHNRGTVLLGNETSKLLLTFFNSFLVFLAHSGIALPHDYDYDFSAKSITRNNHPSDEKINPYEN